MKDITVSFETAKRLQKAGWEKETFLIWAKSAREGFDFLTWKDSTYEGIPAPTFAEIWEELPDSITIDGQTATKFLLRNSVIYAYGGPRHWSDDSITENAAAAWINLKERGYIQ